MAINDKTNEKVKSIQTGAYKGKALNSVVEH